MREYIKKTSSKQLKLQNTFHIYDTPVYVLQNFTSKINIAAVIQKIEAVLPQHMLNNVDAVYVADIDEFHKDDRSFNAMYKDGVIYVSPEQDNDQDLLDDIIHEIAHALEKQYHDVIYKDNTLQREFLAKRNTLYYLIDIPNIKKYYYDNINYNAKFDNFMYNDVGYDKLRILSSGLFYSPYAITSLREYWANGFENYLLGDAGRLKELCPVLCNKIQDIIYDKEHYNEDNYK